MKYSLVAIFLLPVSAVELSYYIYIYYSLLLHASYVAWSVSTQADCCSLAVVDPKVCHTMDVLSPFIPVLCHLIDSSTESPVHVLTLSIQAVRVFLAFVYLTLFLALSLSPGNSLVSSWCDNSMLASLL